MKNGIIRFAALYMFNVAVLLFIGLLFPSVSVGFHALWAAVILTIAALFVKPTLGVALRKSAAKSAAKRTKAGEKVVQYVLVYLVELVVWVLTVWLSGVSVAGFIWGYILPPLFLLIGWLIYDLVDDRLRAKTGQMYDAVGSRLRGRPDATTPSAPDAPATRAGRAELADGLTPEQQRMLDGL